MTTETHEETPETPQLPDAQIAFTVYLQPDGNYYTTLHPEGDLLGAHILRTATVTEVATAMSIVSQDFKDQAFADRITRTILANLPKPAVTPQAQMAKALKARKAPVKK